MKIFLDASVIIAAFLSKTGGSAKIFKLGDQGKTKLVTSESVIEETEANLKKIGKTRQQLIRLITTFPLLIRQKVTVKDIEPYQKLVVKKDAHVVAGAVLTGCRYLISLDKKHLLHPKIKNKFKPLKIISPKEFLELYIANK